MHTIFKAYRLSFSFTFLLLFVSPGGAAEPFVYFGLNHTPMGRSMVQTNGGVLSVRPGDPFGEESPFGISVNLGEADAGIFGHLDTYSSLNWDGNSMLGRVYGQLNGEPDQFLCSLGVVGFNSDYYEVTADFSPLGASGVTYLVYNGQTLVATETNVTAPIRIYTWSESSPSANPFWRLPDGSIAAVVQLSTPRTIRLPRWFDGPAQSAVDADRIIIRAENVSSTVDFASRVDLTAGGGEDLIVITGEELGIFNHHHKALGDSLLDAAANELRVARINPNSPDEEIGVSIALENTRQFSLEVRPQELANHGDMLLASAIAGDRQQGGEFLGYVGARNDNGTVQVFGNCALGMAGSQISIFQDKCLVGTVLSPTSGAVVGVAGNPRVREFTGMADAGPVYAGLAVRLDRLTTFTLPDGSTLQGDQIRFAAASRTGFDRLLAFNLSSSNLVSFTITGETGPQTLSLVDNFPEVIAPAFVKAFATTNSGQAVEFIQNSLRTNINGLGLVVLAGSDPGTNFFKVTYTLQEDGLYYHGYSEPGVELVGASGLRALPLEFTVGRTYAGMGSFVWRDPASTQEFPVEVTSVTTIAGFETLHLLPGSFSALRLETITTFTGVGPTNAPVIRFTTNWLAAGVGVVRFVQSDTLTDGGVRTRSGVLSDYAILNTPAKAPTANVGANTVLKADISRPWPGGIQWMKDGQSISNPGPAELRFVLNRVNENAAGAYSVRMTMSQPTGSATGDIASLQVVPFSDTPPLWAAAFGASAQMDVRATAVDSTGNMYLAGLITGTMYAGADPIPSIGGDDIFLLKMDSSGQIAWVRRAGSTHGEFPRALGLDGAGNVFLTGVAGASATFGSLHLASRGIFVTKVDPNGNFLWVTNITGAVNIYDTYPNSIAVDQAGNQYLLGTFAQDTLTFGHTNLANVHWPRDLFLTKIDPNGHFLWALQGSGWNDGWDPEGGPSVYPRSLLLHGSGSLFLAGSFYDQMAFGTNLLSSHPRGQYAGFLAKADLDGNFLWAKTVGSEVQTLASDTAGNVCLAALFTDASHFDGIFLASRFNGGSDACVGKVDSNGNFLWAKTSPHVPAYNAPPLVVDIADNIYLAGGFYNEATYNDTTFSQPAYSSTVLTKLNSAGHVLWNKQLTGVGGNWPSALAPDQAGNVYLAGGFRQQVVFGQNEFNSTNTANAYVVQITRATAPAITQEPQPQRVTPGEPVTFSVAATGSAPLQYQWRKNSVDIEGATGASYSLARANWEDRGTYSVVVKNSGGIVRSAEATLELLAPAAGEIAFAQTNYALMESNTMVVVTVLRTGNTATSATAEVVAANGTGVVGEDCWDTVVSLHFAPGESNKTVSLSIVDDSVSEGPETLLLRLGHPGAGVVIGELHTATITITDNDPPGLPVIRTQPTARSVGVGGNAVFQVYAVGTVPLEYQWRKDSAAITGATNRTLTLYNVHSGDIGAYSVTVRNVAGEVTSSNALLTIVPPPTILVQPQSQTAPFGESVTFSVVASSTLPYVTQVWTRASSGPNSDTFSIPGGRSGTLNFGYDFKSSMDNIAVYTEGFEEEWTLLATLTTNGMGQFTVNYGNVPGGRLVILVTPSEGEEGDGWSYEVQDVGSPLTYRWEREEVTVGGTGPTYTIPYVHFSDAGLYWVTVSDPYGSIVSSTVSLTVTGPLVRIARMACSPGEPACYKLWWNVAGYRLERSQTMKNDDWQEVADAYSGMTLPAAEAQVFFRLAQTTPPQ